VENFESYYLYPAALYASNKPYYIKTILGSCIAVCIWDSSLNIGGMCHYMLPYWNGNGLASPKYGNIAIEKLYNKMLNYGSDRNNLKAKVFGGGEVIDVEVSHYKIGKRNIMLAKEMLKEYKIQIVASSVGGKLGRKIIFNTKTGEIRQRFVKRQL
jgi:chemotaxis protein CheD